MAQLNTARGAIDTADLGVTLMHEHVFVLSPEIVQNYPEVWGEEARREADAIRRLNELKAPGVDSIVGLTVIGLGRYIPRIAAATELNIVVATGVYTYNDVPMHFHFTGPGTVLDGPEPMTELFVRDIEEGIAGTGVKAAILKCATDEPGVTPGVERVLRAVAQAHLRTGVPISTHTHAATRRGLDRQRVLHRDGPLRCRHVPAVRGPGGHRGSHVRTRARRQDGPVARCALLHRLAARGAGARRAAELAFPAYPQDVLPALRERGVTDDQIRAMLVDNPRRIFHTRGGY